MGFSREAIALDSRRRFRRAQFRRWFGVYFAAAFAVFALGGVVGAVIIHTIDLGGIEAFTEGMDSLFPDEITFWFLVTNNLRVLGILTLGLVSFGVISGAVLFFNGFILGLVVAGAGQEGELLEVFLLVAPHGVFELGAFWLVGGLTFRVTHRFVNYLRGVDDRAITKQELFEILVLVVVAALAIVIAAWIEVNLTTAIARAVVGPL